MLEFSECNFGKSFSKYYLPWIRVRLRIIVLVAPTCAAGNWSESSYGSSGIHCLCSKHHRIYSQINHMLRMLKRSFVFFQKCIVMASEHFHTHSKDRIQQPRAIPNRMFRVRLCSPDTT